MCSKSLQAYQSRIITSALLSPKKPESGREIRGNLTALLFETVIAGQTRLALQNAGDFIRAPSGR